MNKVVAVQVHCRIPKTSNRETEGRVMMSEGEYLLLAEVGHVILLLDQGVLGMSWGAVNTKWRGFAELLVPATIDTMVVERQDDCTNDGHPGDREIDGVACTGVSARSKASGSTPTHPR